MKDTIESALIGQATKADDHQLSAPKMDGKSVTAPARLREEKRLR